MENLDIIMIMWSRLTSGMIDIKLLMEIDFSLTF